MALMPMGAWADTTDIFTFEMKGSNDVSMEAGTTGNVNLVSNDYATVTGGSVDYYQAQSGTKAVTYIKATEVSSTTKTDLRFTTTGSYLKVTLSNTVLSEGDVISFTTWSNETKPVACQISFSKESNASVPTSCKTATVSDVKKHEVQAADDICGQSVFYIWRGDDKVTYIHSITITRTIPTSTGCTVTDPTPSAVIYALNSTSPSGLPTEVGTTEATWAQTNYSFSLSGGDLRDLNNSTAARQITIDDVAYRPIIINKGGTYTITKSANITAVTLYAKTNATSGDGATLTFNKGLTGETTTSNLPLLETDASSFDVSSYSTITVNGLGVVIALKITYNSHSASLTVADIGWASMYLPFDAAIPEFTKVYYAKATTADAVTLTEITTSIPANTGVLVKAEPGKYSFEYTATTPTALGHTNLLKGVTIDKQFEDSEIYVLAGSDNDKANPVFNLYASGEGTINLAAYKAYLPKSNVPNAGNSRTITFGFEDDETTGINDVRSNTENGTTQYYDLSGRRVTHPTKGLYIVNGKKVIIK